MMADVPVGAFLRLLRATLALYGAAAAQRALFELRDSSPPELKKYSDSLDDNLAKGMEHIKSALEMLEKQHD